MVAQARRGELRHDGAWLAVLAFPILVSHQTEEWVRPGGFLPFCNHRVLGSDRPTWPLTERVGFHVNVTIGWSTALAGAALWRRSAVPAAAVLGLEAGNALMHTGMAVRERGYNPGVATGALLMGVHAIAGGRWLARSGRLSLGGASTAVATAAALSAGLPALMKRRLHHGHV